MPASLHQRLDELLAGEAAADLTAAECVELEALLASAPERGADRQAYTQLLLLMGEIPRTPVPIRLERRVLALATTKPVNSLPHRLTAALAVGLAGLSIVLFWELQQQRYQFANHQQPPQPQPSQVQRRFELIPVSASPSGHTPTMQATLLVRPAAATNLLTVHGLPPLAPDHTYRLWAETPKGLQGCMSFVPDAHGSVSIQVPSEPSGSATRVQISIDSIAPGVADNHPGRAVLVST